MEWCLTCDADISDLVTMDGAASEEYIVCPECGAKMVVDYEENYDLECTYFVLPYQKKEE